MTQERQLEINTAIAHDYLLLERKWMKHIMEVGNKGLMPVPMFKSAYPTGITTIGLDHVALLIARSRRRAEGWNYQQGVPW